MKAMARAAAFLSWASAHGPGVWVEDQAIALEGIGRHEVSHGHKGRGGSPCRTDHQGM